MSDTPRIDSSFSNITVMNIARFMAASDIIHRSGRNKSIMIKGVHGVGKSAIIAQLSRERAKNLNLEFVKFQDIDPRSILAQLPNAEEMVEDVEYNLAHGKIWFDPKKHFVFYDIRLATRDYVDFVGGIDKSTGVTRFVSVDWIVLFGTPGAQGVLFFDELDQAPKSVQNACFEIVHDRQINTNALSDGVSIFSAGNSGIGATIYSAKPLSAALNDRFWTIHLVPSKQEWVDWCLLQGTSGHEVLARFMKTENGKGHLDFPIERRSEPDAVLPSRRSWGDFALSLSLMLDAAGFDPKEALEDFDDIDAEAKDKVGELGTVVKLPDEFDKDSISLMSDVLKGFVGEDSAVAFVGWLKDSRPLLSLNQVLEGKYDPANLPSPPTLIMVYRHALKNIERFVDAVRVEGSEEIDYYVPNAESYKLGAFYEEVYEAHADVAAVLLTMTIAAMLGNQARVKMFKALIAKGGTEFSNKSTGSGPLEHVMTRAQDTDKKKGDEGGFHDYEPIFSDYAKRVRQEKKVQWAKRVEREKAEAEEALAKGLEAEEQARRVAAVAADDEFTVTVGPGLSDIAAASTVPTPPAVRTQRLVTEFLLEAEGTNMSEWPAEWAEFTDNLEDYSFRASDQRASEPDVSTVQVEISPTSIGSLSDLELMDPIVESIISTVIQMARVTNSVYEPTNKHLTLQAIRDTLLGMGLKEVQDWN